MANKVQVRKFLELKRDQAVSRLKEESEKLQKSSKELFFEDYKVQLDEIKKEVIQSGIKYDQLIKSIEDTGKAGASSRYSTPEYYFNELTNRLTISKHSDDYIKVIDAQNIKNAYSKKVEECESEYNGLIAVCNASNAKDSVLILENLGFDLSEIEIKKEECTSLITNIDASKLFIVKEDK
jgi:hypothetical protein